MEHIKLVKRFWQLFSEQKWDEAQALLHPEFIAEWPQSRERMRDPKNFRTEEYWAEPYGAPSSRKQWVENY